MRGVLNRFRRQRTPREQSSTRGSGIPNDVLLDLIHQETAKLATASYAGLIAATGDVRSLLAEGTPPDDPVAMVTGLSVAAEAIRRATGLQPYDVQLLAALALCRSQIAQMQTGEGKTLSAIAAAVYLGMSGLGVHVMTPNLYLAERDAELAGNVSRHLEMTALVLPEQVPPSEKFAAYDSHITYGTGHEFGFDYLKDQLALRQHQGQRPGTSMLQELRRDQRVARRTMQRGLACAIVDEADSVMMDDAASPLILSMQAQGEAPDAAAHRLAHAMAEVFVEGEDFIAEPSLGRIELTTEGIRRCHASDVPIPVPVLVRPWTEYMTQALRANVLFRRNVHYVIQDDEVRIVDETTGRIFEDRSWQDGLHQAIETLEGLPINAEKVAAAQITRQRFFRLYSRLSGMTGTAIGLEREFQQVFRLPVTAIPLRVPSARSIQPSRFFASSDAKWAAIAENVCEVRANGRPVLVGTRSIDDTERIVQLLKDRIPDMQILNGVQDAEEADVVAQAGRRGVVTIATNMAGRGTDILLTDEVRECGGLHVIVAECQTSGRMDRQLIGRCARQGDPGSACVFVSADDVLLRHFGPWLADAIRREADPDGEARVDFSSQLRRVQATAERSQYSARMELLRHDNARDVLLGTAGYVSR
ncbi:MAG: hypothetical protein KDA96_08915 [Planctomycetaceae bacterium]|nr:hypothetical protein [Planctomycetaceae bacterium]